MSRRFTIAVVAAIVVAGAATLVTLVLRQERDRLPSAENSAPQPAPRITVVSMEDTGEFAGIAFGTPIQAFDGAPVSESGTGIVPRKTYLYEEIEWYQRATDPIEVDGVKVRGIYYGFVDGRFVEAIIVPDDTSDAIELLGALEAHFPGRRVGTETWLWVGEKTGIDYSGYCTIDSSGLSNIHVFPSERVIAIPPEWFVIPRETG
jgi:hypothetical protein